MKIFGNEISHSSVRKAKRNREKFIRKFGFDPEADYPLTAVKNDILGDQIGIKNLIIGSGGEPIKTAKSIVLGTIRMGYGHYRPAMAIASAARSMGITPYWLDLLAYEETTGAKIIHHLEKLYSLGSRLSQKSRLFNRLYWEPLTAEGFKKLDFNASDRLMCELMAPIFRDVPDSVPVIATHAWAALGALSAGKRRVVNMIPDNWPLGLHLTEGPCTAYRLRRYTWDTAPSKTWEKRGKPSIPFPPGTSHGWGTTSITNSYPILKRTARPDFRGSLGQTTPYSDFYRRGRGTGCPDNHHHQTPRPPYQNETRRSLYQCW